MIKSFFTRKDVHWTTKAMLPALMLFIAPLANATTTNIVYTLNATPPQNYTAGERLILSVKWHTEAGAEGFAHLRLISENPASATSPALSALLTAGGSFAMVQADRALVLQNLTAGNAAKTHSADVQIYPSLHSTKIAGDFVAAWPHPLETAQISGKIEVVMCGEGIRLDTVTARWTTNPTLFLVK